MLTMQDLQRLVSPDIPTRAERYDKAVDTRAFLIVLIVVLIWITLALIVIWLMPRTVAAQTNDVPLQVAYAGSMGSLMDGGVKPAVVKALNADLQGRAQGSTG